MRRIKFLILGLLCLLIIGGFAYSRNFYGLSTVVRNFVGKDSDIGVTFVRQLVTEDNTSSRTIMFAGEERQAYSIEYRAKGGSVAETVVADDVSFTDGEDKYFQYAARLEGLAPGTAYEYRVVLERDGGRREGSWHELATDDGQGFTALIFADAQSGNDYEEWISIANRAYRDNPQAKLHLHLGDNVDNGAIDYQWKRWLTGIEPFSADIPLASALGNHEMYDLDWEERFPETYVRLFQFPSPLEEYENQFYSFDYGNVHFVVLDTNCRDEMLPFKPGLAAAQLAWLEDDLAAAGDKWKVVLMHRDILLYEFSEESGRPCDWATFFMDIAYDFMPVFERYGVDAVLSGHLHSYRRRVKLKNFQPDEEGITYIMTGVSGSGSYGNLWADSDLDAKRSPDRKDPGNYMTMSADDKQLIFRAFLPDGKQFDEVVLKR